MVPIDLDIEKTLRRLRRERRETEYHRVPIMAEDGEGGAVRNRALKDYSIPDVGISSIQRPPIQYSFDQIVIKVVNFGT